VRGAAAALEEAVAVERRARTVLRRRGERVALDSLDAVIARLLTGDTVDRVLEQVETARLAQRVAERLLQDGIVEQLAQRAIAGPELERVIATALASRLPELVVTELIESEALWVLVDEIARSPSVTDAIAHQGTGFAEQVASVARDRSRYADAWVEQVAHRVRRRHRRQEPRNGIDITSPPPLAGGDAR
jgi:hypothetical protein